MGGAILLSRSRSRRKHHHRHRSPHRTQHHGHNYDWHHAQSRSSEFRKDMNDVLPSVQVNHRPSGRLPPSLVSQFSLRYPKPPKALATHVLNPPSTDVSLVPSSLLNRSGPP